MLYLNQTKKKKKKTIILTVNYKILNKKCKKIQFKFNRLKQKKTNKATFVLEIVDIA